MKTRIYQLLKYLTVLTLLLTFVNCNKEQPEDEILMEQVVKPKYVLKKITYDDYSKNKYLSNKLDAINKKDSNPLRGSREESSEDKYYLNLNEATYIEDAENNFHSYTFSVNSADEESSIIENVILVSTTSEEYKAYLTTYNLTEEEKEKIINGEVVDLEGKASLKPIESNQIITFGIGDSGCYEFKEVPGEWEDCEHSNHQNAHEVNGFCDHPTAVIDWVEVDCRQESGGGGDPTNNGSTSAGTTTGGSSHNTGSLSTAITS